MASSSADETGSDCIICLDAMDMSDHKHPLQCATKQCGFNMCLSCLESLITSSKDDYKEASDGSLHVKIFLYCPNCRSNLSESIRETLLLRKADFLLRNPRLPDEDLTPSQSRMRKVIHETKVQTAIQEARKKELDFFGEKDPSLVVATSFEESYLRSTEDKQEQELDHEEWGVEVDIHRGVHSSIRLPRIESPNTPVDEIDDSLFGGLKMRMTHEEQVYVTELMTSGDVDKLAQAPEILHGVLNSPGSPEKRVPKSRKRKSKRSSVFMLIEEAEQARPSPEKEAQRIAVKAAAASAIFHGRRAPGISPHSLPQMQAAAKLEYMRLHPLPVRMPKYVELDVENASSYMLLNLGGNSFPLTFCDDEWDGTVMDAYCKITIGHNNGVFKKKTSNRGVVNVLSGGNNPDDANYGDARVDVPSSRVLVASVWGEAGKQGIMKGDVVTHVNGKKFNGNSEDLMALIMDGRTKVTLVLNAERSIAEALKRRASCLE